MSESNVFHYLNDCIKCIKFEQNLNKEILKLKVISRIKLMTVLSVVIDFQLL